MKNFWKVTMTCLAVAALCALPAAAAETAKGTCTTSVGTNTVTYDCNYVSRGYEVATPLTLQMDYACSVRCGGVLAFGLSGPGFTPKGDVEGHVMSVQRGAGSMTFSLMFDKLHQDSSAQGNSNGTAFMTVLLNVDDGTGRFRPTALPFKVHVNSNAGSSGSN